MEQQDQAGAPEQPVESSNPVDRAASILAQREAERQGAQPPQQPPQAPQGKATPEDGAAPELNAADRVLAGEPEKPTEPLDAEDPKSAAAIAKFLELDRAQRARERELDELRRQVEAEKAQTGTWSQAATLAKSGKKLEALKAIGITYEDLAAEAINGGKPDFSPLEAQIAELKAQLEELPKTYEEKLAEATKQREEAEHQMWRQRTQQELKGDADRWGLLTDPRLLMGKDPVDLVYATIEDHHKRTGELLTEADAADMLETALERRVREASVQGGPSKLDRIRGLTAPTAPKPSPESSGTGRANGPSGPSTITNGHAAGAPERRSPSSEQEAQALAIETARRLMQR